MFKIILRYSFDNSTHTSKFAFWRAKKVFLVINCMKLSIENRNASSLAKLKISPTDGVGCGMWDVSVVCGVWGVGVGSRVWV